ncbi:MAG: PIN domain-containing protein [Nitrospirales bacterium]
MMRDLFSHFYRPTKEEFKKLWKEATIVLDANVLLNNYRYSEDARKDLLSTLGEISSRIWVPHQVVLEFQRNRLNVITESIKPLEQISSSIEDIEAKFENIRKKIEESQRRGILGSIGPEKIKSEATKGLGKHKKKLEELKERQLAFFDQDAIEMEIASLLQGRIGPPPTTQEELNEIYAEGEERFSNEIPPGYLDQSKDSQKHSEIYISGGLRYKRKYGDLLLWKQIIKYAKDNKVKSVIFITGDQKEDWWWKENCNGEKTIGPRPELVDEIKREGEVSLFYMYSPERFLDYAQKELNLILKPTSLEQIKEVSSRIWKDSSRNLDYLDRSTSEVLDAVSVWAQSLYPGSEKYIESLGPEISYRNCLEIGILTRKGSKIGFGIEIQKTNNRIKISSLSIFSNPEHSIDQFDERYMVVVIAGDDFPEGWLRNQAMKLIDKGWDGVYFGEISYQEDDILEPCFKLIYKVLSPKHFQK